MTLLVGDAAPDFSATSDSGATFTLSESLTRGPVALVFFPLAFSGRCQAELCEIRDNIEVFSEEDVTVVGVSIDSHYSLAAWKAEQNYAFELVSDRWPVGEISRSYGVFLEEAGISNRATFLIDQEGILRWSVVTDPGTSRSLGGYREAIADLVKS